MVAASREVTFEPLAIIVTAGTHPARQSRELRCREQFRLGDVVEQQQRGGSLVRVAVLHRRRAGFQFGNLL